MFAANNTNMNREEALNLCKYYKGEETNPFDHKKEYAKSIFWDAEQMYVVNCTHDDDFHERMKKSLLDALSKNQLRGTLVDESVSLDKRALILYIDLLHARKS